MNRDPYNLPQEELDILFTRKILCAMIECAVRDIQNETEYQREWTQGKADFAKQSGITFLQSRLFEDLCDTLGLPSSKIRQAAFK